MGEYPYCFFCFNFKIMSKTNQIIFSIKDQCTGKIPSDDTRLTDSWILYKMNNVRALLIKESIVSSGIVDESYYQLKCCLQVKCDNIECGGVDSGMVTYYVEMPKLMEGIGWKNITYFGTVEFPKYKRGLHMNFDRYSYRGFLGLEYQEWIGKRPSFTVIGGYKDGDTTVDGNLAMIKNLPSSGIKFVCVNGIWANPEEAVCEEEDIMDVEYPLPDYMIHRLEMIVIQQILSTEVVPGDPIQDSRDNTGNSSQPIDPRSVAQQNQKDYKVDE